MARPGAPFCGRGRPRPRNIPITIRPTQKAGPLRFPPQRDVPGSFFFRPPPFRAIIPNDLNGIKGIEAALWAVNAEFVGEWGPLER